MNIAVRDHNIVPSRDQDLDRRGRKGFDELTATEQSDCAGDLAAAVKQISNQHRLLILAALCQGAYSVNELQHKLGRSQPSISNDLILLRNLGLVETSQKGSLRITRLCEHVKTDIQSLLRIFEV